MLGILGKSEDGVGAVGLAPIFRERAQVLAGEKGADAAFISCGNDPALESEQIHGGYLLLFCGIEKAQRLSCAMNVLRKLWE